MAGRGVRRAVAVLVASVLLSGCWLQPGFDGSQTRWNPLENRLMAANVAHLAELWSVDISTPGLYEPLVQGGRVYVGRRASQSTGGGVRALDAATGETVWDRATTPAGGVLAHPPTFVEGELWSSWWQGFGEPGRCDFGTVRLDRDGNVVGSDDAGFPVSRPVQSGPYVLQVLRPDCPPDIYFWIGATLRVRDSRTLATLWTADADVGTISGGQILAASGFFPLAGCGAPTCTPTARGEFPVTGDQPYVAGPNTDVFGVRGAFGPPDNAEVFALSRSTGEVAWRATTYSGSPTLAVDDNHLYVAPGAVQPGDAATLLAFDTDGCGRSSCRPLWSGTVTGAPVGARSPTVGGDVVYVAGTDNTIRAYPADGCGRPTCPEIGRVAVDGLIETMSVAEGRLFVTSRVTEGSIYRVTAFAPRDRS